jgi:GntR family transcriptional regulator
MPIQPLDRASPMPLWAQLEAELRRRLDAGEIDTRFPTDLELTEVYGVSRHTVREAIRNLNKTGMLKRERGRGTVVNRAEFEQPLGALYSLFQSIESTGVDQRSVVLNLSVLSDPTAASHLQLGEDAELVYLERLRLAGEAPLAVDRAWLPHSVAGALLDVDFGHTALYDELDRVGARRPNSGWERLTPIIPAASDRELLGLGRTDAAFFLERLGSRDGTPIEWRTTTIRGDRYRFVANWTAGTASGLELRLAR